LKKFFVGVVGLALLLSLLSSVFCFGEAVWPAKSNVPSRDAILVASVSFLVDDPVLAPCGGPREGDGPHAG